MGALIHVGRGLGDGFSEGARLLWLAARREKLTQEQLRAELDVSKGCVGRWLRGERRPDGRSRGRLFTRFGIRPEAWEQKPTRPFSLGSAA